MGCIHINLPLLEHFQRKLDLLKRNRLKRRPETEVNKQHEHLSKSLNTMRLYHFEITFLITPRIELHSAQLLLLISQYNQHQFSPYASANSNGLNPLPGPTTGIWKNNHSRWGKKSNVYSTDQKKPNRERLTERVLFPFHTRSRSRSVTVLFPFCIRSVSVPYPFRSRSVSVQCCSVPALLAFDL